MELSKAFDTINHELLRGKLHTYEFSIEAPEVLLSYLQERCQRVKVNATFSSWTQLLQGVLQGLIPCYLMFTSTVCFFAFTKLIFATLQMTQLHTFVTQT